MTSKEMIDLLGVKVDDIPGDTFTPNIRYLVLNEAVRKIINTVENHNLQALITKEEDLALDSNGKFAISSLTSTPFTGVNGIIEIVSKSNAPCSLRKISYKQYMAYINSGRARYNDPGMYQFGDKYYYTIGTSVYCVPKTYDVDVIYIKDPADISSSQSCELDEMLHHSVVDIAAAMLLNDKNREMNTLYEVETLTQRARATDSNYKNLDALEDEDDNFNVPNIVLEADT